MRTVVLLCQEAAFSNFGRHENVGIKFSDVREACATTQGVEMPVAASMRREPSMKQ